jgi:hypothetical protein
MLLRAYYTFVLYLHAALNAVETAITLDRIRNGHVRATCCVPSREQLLASITYETAVKRRVHTLYRHTGTEYSNRILHVLTYMRL